MSAAAEVVMKDRPMNGAERRKVNRVLARAVALEIIRGGDNKLCRLDYELLPTNRVLERWAIGTGTGLGSDEWDDSRRESRMSPLDDETAIVVDQTILKGIPRYRDLVRQWYCGTGSTTTIAERFRLTRNGLYFEWRCSLFYFRDQFRATGHPDLVSLLERLD
jgi:hypothetical protein